MIERGIIMRKFGKVTLLLAGAVMAMSVFAGCGKKAKVSKEEPYATLKKSDQSMDAKEICSWLKYKTEEQVDIMEMDLSYCSEKIAVISDSVGSVIYDRKKHEIVAAIDLEEIGCDHFNSSGDEEKPGYETKIQVSKDEKNLIIYNQLQKDVEGYIYVYDLNKIDENKFAELKPQKKINEKDKLYKTIVKFNKNTKQDPTLFTEKYEDEMGDGFVNSSYYAYQWKNYKGEKQESVLAVDKHGLKLYTLSRKGSQIKAEYEPIQWKSSQIVKIPTKLPQYEYTGKDQRVRAAFEEVKKENEDQDIKGSVVIPMMYIYKIVENEKEAKIYGNFWNESYYRYGSLLKTKSGGSYPGVMHLKKTGDSYKVVKVEYSKDGSAREESIFKMCKGHPVVALKMMRDSISDRKVKKELRTYVKQNHLDVKAYKDSGWDYVNL